MSSDAFTVLVVCTGNLNRSALGAALLRTWAGWYLSPEMTRDVQVVSAGLSAPVGRPMRTRTRVIAESLGADGSAHRASQITEADVRAADLVLVAAREQVDKVLGFSPTALRKTFTIREAGRIAGELEDDDVPASIDELRERVGALAARRIPPVGAQDDIVDPQGKDEDAYVQMAQQEVPALARLAAVLFGMPDREVTAYDAAVEAGAYAFDGDVATDAAGRPRGRREA